MQKEQEEETKCRRVRHNTREGDKMQGNETNAGEEDKIQQRETRYKRGRQNARD